MSEPKKIIHSYRLTSLKEPTEEQLSALMKEVAEEAKCKAEAANRRFFQQIDDYFQQHQVESERKYNISGK